MLTTTASTSPAGLTLGILAGGRATRLGGVGKAWLELDGVPQVLRCVGALNADVAEVLVSANHELERFQACGLQVVADRPERVGQGPTAGLDALALACATDWLLTLPVDLVELPRDLVGALRRDCRGDAAYAHDAEGPQPLVALWRVAALRAALDIEAGAAAVHALHARLGSTRVDFDTMTFGNLNTPADLAAAGVVVAP